MGKEIVCTDGTRLRRVSRWIKLRRNYHVAKRNALWDYVRDEYGNSPSNFKFEWEERCLEYFKFHGHAFATNSFGVLGGPFVGGTPYMYEDEDGKLGVIGTLFMDGPIFGPALYGEWDAYCEYVRLYEEVKHETY